MDLRVEAATITIMKIQAALLSEPGKPLELTELTLDEPTGDELIVRISSSGICHTDIGVQSHVPSPVVLGHEGTGIVAQCGPDVTRVKPGDRVALSFGYCGYCKSCAADMPSHCVDMMALNFSGLNNRGQTTLSDAHGEPVHGSFFSQSSFASHALVNERNAVRVPDSMPEALVGPLGCGVQTGAGAVINTLAATAGSSFVCFGVGAVGLSAVMAAKIVGCDIIVAIDTNAERLQLAAELGATHTLAAGENNLVEIEAITRGGADYSLDTAGTVDTFHSVIACLRMGGHAGLCIVPNWLEGFHFKASALALGRTVTGILEGSSRPHEFIPQLCAWYAAGKLPVDRLVKTYPFDAINEALADLEHGRVIKPVVLMS